MHAETQGVNHPHCAKHEPFAEASQRCEQVRRSERLRNSKQAQKTEEAQGTEEVQGAEEVQEAQEAQGAEQQRTERKLKEATSRALADKATNARITLERRLDDFAGARLPLSDAESSLVSSQEGPLRFKKVQKRTRALIEAEEVYQHALREVQNARLIIDRPETDNLDLRSDPGSSPSPLKRAKTNRMRRQIDHTAIVDAIYVPDSTNDAPMNWNQFSTVDYGEEYYGLSEGRDRVKIDEENRYRETSRGEGTFERRPRTICMPKTSVLALRYRAVQGRGVAIPRPPGHCHHE